ncbi:MAG: DUF1961 family protein [Bacteroidota bacterium]
MRQFLFVMIGLGAVGSCFLACQQDSQQSPPLPDRPNVLFIAVDDLNDWIGCMQDQSSRQDHPKAKTPNMDRLARRGTLFMNAHCQAPICGPSRASLMSGLRPSTTGIYGQINDKNLRKAHPVLETIAFLPEYFGQQGYKTMGVGKLFHQHAPKGVFEVSGGRVAGFGPKPPNRLKWDRKGTSTDWGPFPEHDSLMPDYGTAQWAVDQLQQSHDRPFFLGVGFLRPHVPWHVPQQWFDLYPIDSVQTPPYQAHDTDDLPEISKRVAEVPMMPTTEWAIQTDQWADICQGYLASISFADHYVGQVLDALEASPYANNTIVVLFSDHGYHLGEKNRFAKHSLWEPATKVPLIIAGPNLNTNQLCHQAVQLLDVYPTLVDLCNLPPNYANEGNSLTPLLNNPGMSWPHAAITTYGRNNHAVRTVDHRYIHFEDESEELYAMHKEPDEFTNVAAVPQLAEVKKQARTFLPFMNEYWSPLSSYKGYPYFKQQQEEQIRTPFPQKGQLLYQNAMGSAKDQSGWVMEGPGKTAYKDGWMHMYSPEEEWHHVYWCPEDFPESFVAEWEIQNIEPDKGLVITFFAATDTTGADLLGPHLPKRNGTFSHYTKTALNNYHISYYANNPKRPDRGDSHLRKNKGFQLVQTGAEGIPTRSTDIHQIQLIKEKAHIRMMIDGRKILDWTDDEQALGGGKIGFRQMQWSHFRYRNFAVWAMETEISDKL